jgi:hypothetical protein
MLLVLRLGMPSISKLMPDALDRYWVTNYVM